MSSFRFEASHGDGRIEKGLVEAESPTAARAALRARGLVPLEVQIQGGRAERRIRRRFNDAELALATRQLASLLAAGLPVSGALGAALDQAESRAVREVLAAVRSDVFAGHRLSEALAQFPREFPQVYRASVAAGEDSGELAGVMDRLANYLEEREALRSKVLTAFLYPALVTVVAFVIVIFLMTYVVPQVVDVFRETRQALPWPTRLLLAVSEFLRAAWPWLILGGAAAVYGLRAWLKLPGRRLAWDAMMLELPIAGRITRATNSARFASTLSILVGACFRTPSAASSRACAKARASPARSRA